MKKSFIFIVLLTVVVGTLLPLNAQDLTKGHRIIVVSHRGDWRNAPENSLQAIKNCIDMGVDMVEIDIKKTKDGKLVLLHDNTIDRTMDGKGKVSDYTLAELKALHLKNGAGSTTRHQIPTLEEALLVAKGKILINIDKGYDYFKEVKQLLEKTGTTHQVIVKSNLPYALVLKENPKMLESITYMPVVNGNSEDVQTFISEYLADKRINVFEINFKEDSQELQKVMSELKAANKSIWINTLWPFLCSGMDDDRAVEQNDVKNSWQKVIDRGARYIQTDRPQLLIQYLNKTKQR